MTDITKRPLPSTQSTASVAAAPPTLWRAEPPAGPTEWADRAAAGEPGAPTEARTEPRGTTVVVRRFGPATDCTSSVEFPEHAGLGGMMRYLGHFPPGLYAVTDHLGRAVTPESGAERPEALNALVRSYGLPLPVTVIPRGPRGRVPAPSMSGAA